MKNSIAMLAMLAVPLCEKSCSNLFFIYFIFIFSVFFCSLLKPSMYYTTFKVLKVNFLLYDEVCIFVFCSYAEQQQGQQQRTI